MDGEVIAFGDELASGQRLDTNSRWLSRQLGELGVSVKYHTTVVDDLETNAAVFRQALKRADVVVCTGGLGPTADDLTRQSLAQAAGVDLVRDEQALAEIRALFARRKRDMPQQNLVQALFPRGSRPIRNPHGTAPGIQMEVAREQGRVVRVFALPGVPAEMREMWHESVAPALLDAQQGDRRVIRHCTIKCFGAGESHIEQMLPDLIRRGRVPSVGITASKATISLRISAVGASPAECEQAMAPTVSTIRECLGSLVFGEGDDELEHAVSRLLIERGRTLATAEWGTGGLVAHWLSQLPESSRFFRGGVVSGQHPTDLLEAKLDGETTDADRTNAEKVIKQVAVSLRQQFGADLGLAASDFPAAGGPDESPGSFVMALASEDGVEVGAVPYAGHPGLLRAFSAKRALDFVRLALLAGE